MIHTVLNKLESKAIQLGEVRVKQNLPLDKELAKNLDSQEERLIAQVDVLKECIIEHVWSFTQN